MILLVMKGRRDSDELTDHLDGQRRACGGHAENLELCC